MNDLVWERLKGYELGFRDGQKDGLRATLEWVLTHKKIILFAKYGENIGTPVSYIETPIIERELEKFKMKTRQERLNEVRKILVGAKTGAEKQDLDALTVEGTVYWGHIPIIEYNKEQLIKIIHLLAEDNFTDEELKDDQS